MTAESPTVDEEAQQQPAASRAVSPHSNGTFTRKKAIALGSFFVIAAVLAIALGFTFGRGGGSLSTSSNNADLDVQPDVDSVGDKDSTGGADESGVIDSVDDLEGHPNIGDDGDLDSTGGADEPDVVDSGADLDAQPNIGDDGDGDSTDGAEEPSVIVDPPPLDTAVPPVVQAKFLRSSGPLQSRVRIASPDIANGYSSCDGLKDDIVEALKFYANSIIMSEQSNDWCAFLAALISHVIILKKRYRYEKCDPKNPNYWWGGEPEFALADEGTSALESAAAPPASESFSAPQANIASKVDATAESTESSYGM